MKPAHSPFFLILLSFVISNFALPTFAIAKPTPSPNLAPSAAIAGPTDTEIMHIFVTTNSIASELSKMAQKQSKNNDIVALAKSLDNEHNELSRQVTDFAKKSGSRPVSNLTSQGLTNEARLTTNKLKPLQGKEFDQAFLSAILTFHEKAAAHLDDNLLTNVKDNEVKGILLKARPQLGLQITKIKKIQTDLNK